MNCKERAEKWDREFAEEEARIKSNKEWAEANEGKLFIDTHGGEYSIPSIVWVRGSNGESICVTETFNCNPSITHINYLEEFDAVKYKEYYHKFKLKELERRVDYHRGEIG